VLRPIHTKRVYVRLRTSRDGRRRAWCEWALTPYRAVKEPDFGE